MKEKAAQNVSPKPFLFSPINLAKSEMLADLQRKDIMAALRKDQSGEKKIEDILCYENLIG